MSQITPSRLLRKVRDQALTEQLRFDEGCRVHGTALSRDRRAEPVVELGAVKNGSQILPCGCRRHLDLVELLLGLAALTLLILLLGCECVSASYKIMRRRDGQRPLKPFRMLIICESSYLRHYLRLYIYLCI